MTLQQIFQELAKITGQSAPKLRIPYAVAYAAGVVLTAWAGVTGKQPLAPLDGVRMARQKMWVRHDKAANEPAMLRAGSAAALRARGGLVSGKRLPVPVASVTAPMKTWLVVAAERREFDGMLKRLAVFQSSLWPGARHAFEADSGNDRWLLVAPTGPGPSWCSRFLSQRSAVGRKRWILRNDQHGSLRCARSGARRGRYCRRWRVACRIEPAVSHRGAILSRPIVVAVTPSGKVAMRKQTGAIAVEMESALRCFCDGAAEWGVPFFCVRAVSDTAADSLPLDFNQFRDAEGRFFAWPDQCARRDDPPFSVMPALLNLIVACRRCGGGFRRVLCRLPILALVASEIVSSRP